MKSLFLFLLSLLSLTAYPQAFFIHGTNATNKTWNESVRAEIRDIFGHQAYPDSIELLSWSGANNTAARKGAAEELLAHISNNLHEKRMTLIGHSHGGNVILWASQQLAERWGDEYIIQIVTLNTPCVVGGASLAESSLPHYHIYCPHDQIVPRGGFNKTGIQLSGGDKKVWPGMPNGGEFSFAKDVGSGKWGASSRIFSAARQNIPYRDQYRFKGLKPKIHVSCHKANLPKNVQEWAPQLRTAISRE